MNKLSREKRAQILHMLVEGMSMRATSRVSGVAIDTVVKLMIDAGKVCAEYHDNHVKDVQARRVQADEIWSFCYSKERNAPYAEKPIDKAGDVWTWTGIDADSKLIISWAVGGRDGSYALELMDDLRKRLANRVQLTTDGHKAYLEGVEGAFGGDVDYAQLIKLYGSPPVEEQRRYSPATCVGTERNIIVGDPDDADISTSYVERQNLTMRMSMRRFTRLTNAFSKKLENHCHSLALYFTYYNWIRGHKSLKGQTPAQAAGLTDKQFDLGWIADMVDENQKPKKRGPYKPRKNSSISN